MASSQARIDANRRNSLKSTGPKTLRGKSKSKYNGLTHGLTARTPVLPKEDPWAFEKQLDRWIDHLDPRDRLEQILAEQAARTSWFLDRAARVKTARLSLSLSSAARREQEEVIDLGQRLFLRPSGASVVRAAQDQENERQDGQGRSSRSGEVCDSDDPAALVMRLGSTVAGCEWMIGKWSVLRAVLEPGNVWQRSDMLKAIRLLGRRVVDAVGDKEVVQILAASWVIDRERESGDPKIQCAGRDGEQGALLARLRAELTDRVNAADPEAARRLLILIVDRAINRLKVKAAKLEARAERDALRSASCLEFDESPAGKRLLRYEERHRKNLLRTLSQFFEIRHTPSGLKPQRLPKG
jgi:hypothetical protein